MKIAVYSTKQYDKKYLQHVNDAYGFELEFFDFLLTEKTAKTANGCEAVCIFVNDDGSRPVLEELKAHGVKYIALRCAGFNNVDLDAAKELGLRVVRAPLLAGSRSRTRYRYDDVPEPPYPPCLPTYPRCQLLAGRADRLHHVR